MTSKSEVETDKRTHSYLEEAAVTARDVVVVDRGNGAHAGLQKALYNDEMFGRVHLTWGLETTWERICQLDSPALVLNVGSLGEAGAARFIEQIRARDCMAPILVFGWEPTQDSIVRLIEAGATSYVRSQRSATGLAEALRAMISGQVRLCPDVAARMMRRIAELAGYRLPGWNQNGNLASPARLTDRQSEVLHLLRRGMSNAEIASELVIEVGTVKNHVHNLLKKLGASDRYEAASLQPALIDGGWQLQH